MNTALLIIFVTIVFSAGLGIFAGRKVKMNLENWTVGGRRFGVILIWLLMAGEIYTTFTFLGASGWAYSRGAPTYYILIYGTLAYTVSFFILPAIWKVGKRYGLHTQPDFFIKRYDSRGLGVLVAGIGVLSIIPYLQLQLAGLGLIVEVASGGAVQSNAAILVGFVLTCAFVYTSGIRGTAWVSIVKDAMMIAAVAIVGIGVPHIYFGGFGKMFRSLIEAHPNHLVFPGAAPGMDVLWVMSTVLLTGLGFYMWPHVFGSAFSARSAETIKRNAVIMPFYQIPILLVVMVGFTALLVIPGLRNGDMAFLELVNKTYPSWFMGFVGAAGAVTAMVPSSVLVLFASTLLAKNVYQAGFAPKASEERILGLSRLMVLIIMGFALLFAIFLPNALVNLLLIGYDGVSQFFPGVVLGLFWKRVQRRGVVCGLVTGFILAAVLVFSRNDPFLGLNAGFVALVVNAVVTVAVSLMGEDKRAHQNGNSPSISPGI
ncbi:MAG: sodium:solute symporter family protein [Clostridiales bacterium]|nr:sodium:solute symporter family protein [Clostridiales bacterium]